MDGTNWYVYCKGNPINFVDPWGLRMEKLRELSDNLGADISWNSKTSTATVKFFDKEVNFFAGDGRGTIIQQSNEKMYVDGEEFAKLIGGKYEEINGDGYEGYRLTYIHQRDRTSGTYISVESALVEDSAAGQRYATYINGQYNGQFQNSIEGIELFGSIGTFNSGKIVSGLMLGGSLLVGRATSNMDVSPKLCVGERISRTMMVGYSSVSRPITTYKTIIRNTNGDIRYNNTTRR